MDIKINPKYRDEIVRNYKTLAGVFGVKSEDVMDKIAEEAVSFKRAEAMKEEIQAYVPLDAVGSYLEIGSGYSVLLAHLIKDWNIDGYGLEPFSETYPSVKTAKKIFRDNGLDPERIIDRAAEAIPFPDNRFGLIYSNSTLEHVQDPAKVLSEIFRVLKPGGTAVLNFPNYGSLWESHYGLPYPMFLPKRTFKLYVKLLGRDPEYAGTLNFITYGKLQKMINPFRGNIRVLGYGREKWRERIESLDFSEWAFLKKLKGIMTLIKRMRMTGILLFLGGAFHWETPFILVFQKES